MALLAWVVVWPLIGAGSARAAEVQASNSVAVLDFVTENPVATTGDWTIGLEDYFEMSLEKQNVPVLERRNIRLVLSERGLQSRGSFTAASLSQAKLPSVNFFLSGTLVRPAAHKFVLTVSVVQADKAEIILALTQSGVYPNDWLPAINSLAQEVGQRLQVAKPGASQRSEFEMMTWLPEAALPFFKGLEFCARGDYAAAVPWFRHSYERDRHFDIALRWEARAYRKLGLAALAQAAGGGTNAEYSIATNHRPVVAVAAAQNISASERAAFVESLAKSGRFEIFDAASIGATAREIDLQLTGQMAAPLDERSVWMVVDGVIFLNAPDSSSLTAREQEMLSGESGRTAQLKKTSKAETDGAALAKAFLASPPKPTGSPVGSTNSISLSEPNSQDNGEDSLAKALRLVQAAPDDARRWVGLSDCYGDKGFKNAALNEAIKAIERNPQKTDAAFWLSSALWRKRQMTCRYFYEPTAHYRAPNPLTNDFAQLLQWFPDSKEAVSLMEENNHGGAYNDVEPKDPSYVAAVFGKAPPWVTRPNSWNENTKAVAETSVPTDAQRLDRLQVLMREGRTAPAWQLANILIESSDQSIQSQAQPVFDRLLQIAVHDRQLFQEFNSTVTAGNSQRVLELGQDLLKCSDRRQRATVINQCGEIIRKQKGIPGQLKFLFAQARQYRDDFLLDPVTGWPAYKIEYQLLDGISLVQPVIYGKDYGYEPLMGTVALTAHDQPPSDLTKEILNYIRNDPVTPLERRLTAAYDLALWDQVQGDDFEALDQFEDVLRQTEGTNLPLTRGGSWSVSIESAAFDALHKMRIYSGVNMDVCDCCGKGPAEPPQKPANYDEINHKLEQLWKQQIGEVGTNVPPISQQFLADKENFFPVIFYKLSVGEDVYRMLIFCEYFGTNALPALPIFVQIIQRGDGGGDYYNALMAIGALGHAAGCARPLLILAREAADNLNFNYALQHIGPAPPRVMPLLAQLLYHKDPEICKLAANAVMETADLRAQFQNLSAEQQVVQIRKWWDETGIKKDWQSNP